MTRNADLMTQDQIEKLHQTVLRLTSFLNLIKVMTGILMSIVFAIVGVALWVNNTSTALADTKHAVANIVRSREQSLAEWSKWREQKDSIDVRMVVLFENQQETNRRLEDRQTKIWDIMQGKVDRQRNN